MRRRIAIVIRSLAAGGAEKQAVLLAQALAPHHDLRLVVTRANPCESGHLRTLARAGVETRFLAGPGPRKLQAFARSLHEERVEIVFAHLPGDTLLAAMASALAGVEICFGGLRNTHLAEHKWRTLRWLHRHRLSGSISNSYAARDIFSARGFDAARLHVLPNGIVLPPEAPPRRAASSRVQIVSVGRLVAQKDHRTSLAAMELLRARLGPRFRFHLAGAGPEEAALRSAVVEASLEDVVSFDTSPDCSSVAHARADIHLSASRFEGLSNAVMEAMAHGLPIVATDVGDNARLVGEGDNGHLVQPGDPRALAERLEALIHSEAQRRRQGERSFERIRPYGFEHFAKRYLDFVEVLP